MDPNATPPEDCPASAEWLPANGGPPPALELFEPTPHPDTECPFYRGGWQTFLAATTPDANGDPAIASFPTIDDLFTKRTPLAANALMPAGQHRGTPLRAWLGDIKQAGNRNILIDQNGHSLYYGIHVNQAYVDFVNANNLTTAATIQAADKNLFFPAGVTEFKTAWQEIGAATDPVPAAYTKYITTNAWVATIHQDPASMTISEDKNNPRQVKVALIAMHVVYSFPGHPEFVWTSFQHVDDTQPDVNTKALGRPDTAPTFTANPTTADPNNLKNSTIVSDASYVLYHGGTPANQANPALVDSQLQFDDASQTFVGNNSQTSIYRMYPGSKSNDTTPDDAVVALNSNMAALFAQAAPNDLRANYRLVGGTWMDKPTFFALDRSLQNYDPDSNPLLSLKSAQDESSFATISQDQERTDALTAGTKPADDIVAQGSDSPFSILAGEDRMSSTSMESFTQGAASFFNCFRCHNTQAITQRGISLNDDDPTASPLLTPKLLNVSHVFSEFILEECGPQGACN